MTRLGIRLKEEYGEYPVIKTIGSNSQLNITTSYMIKETGNNIDSLVEMQIVPGLKDFFTGKV